jgi:Predicted HD-superfamily hydrolase
MLTPEQIVENFNKFRSLCEKTGDRAPALLKMIDELGERLAMCPASAKKDYHGAYAGGLCDHSLRVLSNLLVLNKSFNWNLPKDSMIIAALCHDIGKVGLPGPDAKDDFYIPQTDKWRVEKMGEEYTYNDSIAYMTTPDRSMFMMQYYGIQLTVDEWLSIKLNDGMILPENKPYGLKMSPLVYAIQTVDYIATMSEKNVWYWK